MGRDDPTIAPPISCTCEFRPYQRRFTPPLTTHHGVWRDRSGILLKLTPSNGRVRYGEIAPLPWFGSETLEAALAYCLQLPPTLTPETIFAIPDSLPACQFGFESAWAGGDQNPGRQPAVSSLCALLPAGERALSSWEPLWQAGYRTFKWKIGVADVAQELQWFRQLQQALPAMARLRLDANGGLTLEQAGQWLESCDRTTIDYLEQPLPPTQLRELLSLQAHHATAIALDESVATMPQLLTCLERGWRGVMVIKPAIVGSPAKLRSLFQTTPIDAVFSSVFETPIGWQAGLHLATELVKGDRAHGYGTSHWFNDPWQSPQSTFDDLWQHL